MHIVVTIIILIVMLGILISAHEAGHLLMAKKFGVYCDEYSIGFGPKLFSHKKKGAETTFSIRAIPLGGYVSMYGEGADDGTEVDERFANIPPERSLEGVSAWERALILIAGITVNLILSFLFCLIYAVSFPTTQIYQSVLAVDISTTESSTRHVINFHNNDSLTIGVKDGNPWLYAFYVEGSEEFSLKESERLLAPGLSTNADQTEYGFIVDSEARLTRHSGETFNVVALFYPASDHNVTPLSSCMSYYLPLNQTSLNEEDKALTSQLGITSFPDFENKVSIDEKSGVKVTMNLSFANMENEGHIAASASKKEVVLNHTSSGWDDKITTHPDTYWLPFGDRLLNGCYQWVNFFPMIGGGIASLFGGNFSNVGGVVAMGASLSQLSSYSGWGKTFFLYGGLISLNLAIFNLLPFPGLDGWGLLVTIIEKIFKKKVPQKAKSIASMVGLGLLMLLAVFITIKDIFQFII